MPYGYLPEFPGEEEPDTAAISAGLRNYLGPQVPREIPMDAPMASPQTTPDYLDMAGREVHRALGPHLSQGVRNFLDLSPVADIRDVGQGVTSMARGGGIGDLGYGMLGFLPGGDALGTVGKAMFAGMGARRVGMEGPSTAARRLGAGDAPADVWKDTGWMRGADGNMRFEIDDSQALGTTWLNDAVETGKAKYGAPEAFSGALSRMLHHPELFEQYPFLRGLRVSYIKDAKSGASRGSFNPDERVIELNVAGRTPAQVKSTLLHEIQHAVQEIEEFARGGNPERIAEMLRARGRDDLAAEPFQAFEGYRRLAGEVEARAVQARQGLTPEERALIFPAQPPIAPATWGVGPLGMYAEDMPRRMQVVTDRAGRTRRAVEAGEP